MPRQWFRLFSWFEKNIFCLNYIFFNRMALFGIKRIKFMWFSGIYACVNSIMHTFSISLYFIYTTSIAWADCVDSDQPAHPCNLMRIYTRPASSVVCDQTAWMCLQIGFYTGDTRDVTHIDGVKVILLFRRYTVNVCRPKLIQQFGRSCTINNIPTSISWLCRLLK